MAVLPANCLSGLTKTERYYQLYLALGGTDDGCFLGNDFVTQLRLIGDLIGLNSCFMNTEWDFYAEWLDFLSPGACTGYPLDLLTQAVYALLYAEAGDPSLVPPGCFLGLPDDERDAAIIIAAGGDNPPADNWILATNFWNDNGIWIDTETWND